MRREIEERRGDLGKTLIASLLLPLSFLFSSLLSFSITQGLVKTASLVGVPLLPPREKITVLLIGNHSAGKSSFINW